jgi:hypothetical protein
LQLAPFATDGTYAIELVVENTRTKDKTVRVLYLTVDTIAPILYLDEPLTGARTSGGKIHFAGRTTNDAALVVEGNGRQTALNVGDDGRFSGDVAVDSGDPAVQLAIVARDGAGNENKAVVEVTNDRFNVPAGLVIKQVPVMKPGDTQKLEAYVRLSDGKDEQGKPKFKEVPAAPDRVSYEVLQGNAVGLADDGTITAQSVGASLLQASYRVTDDVAIQTIAAASVKLPSSTELGVIDAVTEAVPDDGTKTKVKVNDAGERLGYQLVYKVFADNDSAVLPVFGDNLSGWEPLPADGEITTFYGNVIVVAKRTSADKRAVASSGKLEARVQKPSAGVGGGVAAPIIGAGTTINNQSVASNLSGDTLTTQISQKDINPAGIQGTREIMIAARDKSVNNYVFRLDKEIGLQAVQENKSIVIDVPAARVTLTPDMLAGLGQELEIEISPNGDGDRRALQTIAADAGATLLGAGQGVAIRTNIPAANWNSYAKTSVPVPAGIRPEEITAVVLKGPDGQWTTVPWKLDRTGGADGDALVQVQLSGEGNMVFLHNDKTFGDVADDFWGRESIRQAAAKLFVQGQAEDRFEPESSITRAEYPTLLLRVAGLMNKQASPTFTDVGQDDWYSRSVAIAARLGVVNGMDDGSYAPEMTLSRMEAMAMTGRVLAAVGRGPKLSQEEAEQTLSRFTDGASLPEWAILPLALCIKSGIIEGDGDQVNPFDQLTRAQAAAIAVRLSDWLANF